MCDKKMEIEQFRAPAGPEPKSRAEGRSFEYIFDFNSILAHQNAFIYLAYHEHLWEQSLNGVMVQAVVDPDREDGLWDAQVVEIAENLIVVSGHTGPGGGDGEQITAYFLRDGTLDRLDVCKGPVSLREYEMLCKLKLFEIKIEVTSLKLLYDIVTVFGPSKER